MSENRPSGYDSMNSRHYGEKKGLAKLNILPPIRDTIKALGFRGTINQFFPSLRDQSAGRLARRTAEEKVQVNAGESYKERVQHRSARMDTLAKAAAMILQTTDRGDNAFWREQRPVYNRRTDQLISEGSKPKKEVREELIDSLLDKAIYDVRDVMYGDEFAADGYAIGRAVNEMKSHERQLFIRLAPELVKAAREKARKLKDKPAEAQRYTSLADHIVNKLDKINFNGIDATYVGKHNYDRHKSETAYALYELTGEKYWAKVNTNAYAPAEQFFIDSGVSMSNKLELVSRYEIKTVVDVDNLIKMMYQLDRLALKDKKKLYQAFIDKLGDGKVRVGLPRTGMVRLQNGNSVNAEQLWDSNETRLTPDGEAALKNYQKNFIFTLIKLDWADDPKLAAQGMALAANLSRSGSGSGLMSPGDSEGDGLINQYRWGLGSERPGFADLSETCLRALPDYLDVRIPITDRNESKTSAALRGMLGKVMGRRVGPTVAAFSLEQKQNFAMGMKVGFDRLMMFDTGQNEANRMKPRVMAFLESWIQMEKFMPRGEAGKNDFHSLEDRFQQLEKNDRNYGKAMRRYLRLLGYKAPRY